MKVLHITNNFPTSNHPIFGIFVKEQIESLKALEVDCDLFFINGREFGRKAYFRSIFQLRKKLKEGDYDILHVHHAYTAIILVLTLRFFKPKKILSYQSDPSREGGNSLFKFLYSIFDKIIIKNSSQERLKLKKVVNMPNGVNLNFFKPMDSKECKRNLGLEEDKNYILFMDSFNRRPFKRIDRFNNVISILQEKGLTLNIEPLVLTNTDREHIPMYMNASSLHLLTSDFEGSPNSLKECMACNVPVVSTPVGDVRTLLKEVRGSFVADSFDETEIADLVATSLQTGPGNGRDSIIAQSLDINSVAERICSLYALTLRNE